MKFLIEENNQFNDFIIELMKSKEYWDWRNKGKSPDQITEIEITTEENLGYCPVGSIEFCLSYYKKYYNKTIHPINVPPSLYNYSGRNITIIDKLPNKLPDCGVFIKSMTKFKSNLSGKYMATSNLDPLNTAGDSWQVSDYVGESVSEWRAFVWKGELLDIKCYLGDPFVVPDKQFVLGAVKDWVDKPISCTIDFMISQDMKTRVLEAHDFFSCGLYGFSDLQRFPFMCYRWFNDNIVYGK